MDSAVGCYAYGNIVMDTYHRVCQLAPPICSVERY